MSFCAYLQLNKSINSGGGHYSENIQYNATASQSLAVASKAMRALRTKDSYQKHAYHFMNDMYVVCPSCEGQAIIRSPEFSVSIKEENKIKLVCTKCGHSKRLDEKKPSIISKSSRKIITGRYLIIGGSTDPYFNLPLWLTINCCGNILWAYNYEHLSFLRGHIEAKLRERNTQEMANKSLGSRLPKWMTSKKNREIVLKCITELESKKTGNKP